LTLLGCGAEPEKRTSEDVPEDVGVSMGALTDCIRTELANVVVSCEDASGYHCGSFRLMENNFACDEGVVGQASTESLSGHSTDTSTEVATSLFGESFTGHGGFSTVTIATQWGHAYASTHIGWCQGSDPVWSSATWQMDPWSKRAVLASSGGVTCN